MKFPKKLFVKIGDGGSKNCFFDPHSSTDTIADAGETVKVGVYELKQVVEATGSVTVVKTKPVRRRAA